ncbi:MAG: diaminopimelate decarboxylase [Clostridiales bacterium]|jgi:diaminopimelate decarboxylase|nr:diaminopimelate decarboxylase [Clostridiales bacterium]
MRKLNGAVTDGWNFFAGNDPFDLAERFGLPLYVYNENIIRERCREMVSLVSYRPFYVNYSAKANSNLAFLRIVRGEGLRVDAMSPGEIVFELAAGFAPEDIFYVCNNVSAEEMRFAVDKGVTVSVDSLSQLETYGRVNPGGRVAARFNPGLGLGHNAKVVTGGKDTKFGINPEYIPRLLKILKEYSLTLVGINQHMGSLFMDGAKYAQGAEYLLALADRLPPLEFIDIGGGFGIPYHKQDGEVRLDLAELGETLDALFTRFSERYGGQTAFCVEPGRYISAESGVLLGGVYSAKRNGATRYIGTDLGFNVLARPIMYDSYHGVEVYTRRGGASGGTEPVTIVGDICESGDIIAKNRDLPRIEPGDLLGVLDAGAYGFVMSSNYNNRPRPAEVMIGSDGAARLTRRRDTFEDMLRPYTNSI